jgi:glycosyltransferase involved in cell wall biosynthesis
MSSSRPLVSVIVPIYNIENFIDECVKSITHQSYTNLEIILVDDGSTDSSGKIADKYSAKDKRIRVFHKHNGGLSDARNYGLLKAQGSLISFVDGDDFVTSDFIERLVVTLENDSSDIACCSYYKYFNQNKIMTSSKGNGKHHETYTNIDAIYSSFGFHSPVKVLAWNKIYKKSIFDDNSIRFPKDKINEDNLTIYKLLFFANKISFIDDRLVYYRQRSGSIMHRKIDKKDIERRFDIISETKYWLEEHGIDSNNIIRRYRNMVFIAIVVELLRAGQFAKLLHAIKLFRVKI